MKLTRLFFLLLLAVLAAGPACERGGQPIIITEKRVRSALEAPVKAGAATQDRLMLDEEKAAMANPLIWQVPAGWTEDPATKERIINLRFGPAREGECYVSIFPGAAGGLTQNANRWRKQMGLPEATEAEIAALPTKDFLGAPGSFLALDGNFSGMGEAPSKSDYRLLGLIVSSPSLTFFVKMTGPKALIEQNAAAFDQFLQSVSLRRASE